MVAEDRIAALEERVAALEGAEPWRRGLAAGAAGAARGAVRGRRSRAAPRFERSPLRPRRPATPPSWRETWRRCRVAAPTLAVAALSARLRHPARSRPARDLEDFLGGSVLAWLGGVAVLAGLAFLLTIAVSRGWIGEGARTAMAAVLSLGLLGTGIWLREQRGKYEAALAAAAVGIAGSFGTLLVAGPVYHLVPPDVALLGALATGGLATALSIRWNAQVMGWLGLLGALWAPAVLGCRRRRRAGLPR